MKNALPKLLMFAFMLMVGISGHINAQCNCTGCTQTISSVYNSPITVGAGAVICITATGEVTATITVNQGGKVCNSGKITGNVDIGYMGEVCNEGTIDNIGITLAAHSKLTNYGTIITKNNLIPVKSSEFYSTGCLHFKGDYGSPNEHFTSNFTGTTIIDGNLILASTNILTNGGKMKVGGNVSVDLAAHLELADGSCLVVNKNVSVGGNAYIIGIGPGYGQMVINGTTSYTANGAYKGTMDVCLNANPGAHPSAASLDGTVSYCTNNNNCTITPCECAPPVIVLGSYTNKKITCIAGAVQISGVTLQNDTSHKWTTNGTGTFNTNTSLNPSYTPSAADIANGSVKLVFSAQGNCGSAKDSLMVYFTPSVNVTATNSSCAGGVTTPGSVSSNPAGGTTPYTYIWSSGQTSQNISSANAGNYTVTLTDGNGCTATSTGVVNSTTGTSVSTAAIPNKKFTCVTGAVTITGVTVQNGTGNSWTSSGTGNFNNNTSLNPVYTPSAADLASGGVKLIINVSGNCNNAKDSIMLYFVPSVSVTATNPPCGGGPTGSVISAPTGGTQPYTYLWSGNQTTQNISTANPGSYTLTVTDANGCTATSAGVVNANPVTTVSAAAIPNKKFTCVTGAVNITGVTAQNNTTTTWTSSGTGNFNNNTSLNPTYTPSAADLAGAGVKLIISVTGSCNNAKDSIMLYFVPNVSVTATNPSCGGGTTPGSVSSTPTGGTAPYTYTWNSGQTSQNIPSANPGSYTVTVTDANGCTATSGGVVNANPVTSVSAAAIPNKKINCVSGPVNITGVTAQNNTTNSWTSSGTGSFNNNTSLNTTYTPSAADLQSAGVKLIINVAGACNNAKDSIMLYFVPNVQASATSPNCSGGPATGSLSSTPAGGKSPYTYLWSGGQTTQNVSSANPGSYTVTITDGNGCTATSTAVVNAPVPATVSTAVIPNKKLTCVIGPVNITGVVAQNNSTSTWTSNGTGNFSNGSTLNTTYTPSQADFAKGKITLYIDVNGNCGSARDSISLSFGPTAAAFGADPSCGESNYGLADVNSLGSNGKAPYTYVWNTGATTATLPGMQPGSYTVTVTDANGCSSTSVAAVNPIVANITLVQKVDSLIVTPTGAGWTYQWYLNGNPISGATKSALRFTQNGNYMVVVTATNACVNSPSFNVTTTSIASISQKLDVLIVPNPNQGAFSVILPTNYRDETTIELINVIGQQVYRLQQTDNNGKIHVNISELPQGSYFLKIWNESGSTTKFIIRE